MEDKTPAQQQIRQTVVDAGLCTGCGACADICPYQKVYNDRTVCLFDCDLAEGRCSAWCPRTPTDLQSLRQELYDADDLTLEAGPVKDYRITRAKDESCRNSAQHGGTISTLVSLAIETGLVEKAVLSGVGEDLLPHPVVVDNPEAVTRYAGSRMVVSPTIAAFNRLCREPGGQAALVVTPCQAPALAKMKTSPLDKADVSRIGLTIGVFCGWAFDWRALSRILASHLPIEDITGMDIPPSRYHVLEVYTADGTLSLDLDEVTPAVRPGCNYCWDMTAEFSDISVGSARLDEGWNEAKGWNQVIVRSDRGIKLLELAEKRGLLEFHEAPEGNLERLKRASLNKKRTAVKRLIERSGSVHDLGYLDAADPVFGKLAVDEQLQEENHGRTD